jgi:CheY-like chemotaxis protein
MSNKMARILIVEDDPELQNLLQIMLERAGHDTFTSPNGVDALYRVSSERPDLIVLDLMMPWASGDAVLGFVRSTDELKATPVLVVSAHPDGSRLAAQLEADGFLAKPVDMQTLTEQVARLLAPSA